MMEGYNAMLDSLRTGIEQQMAMQRRRQDLEKIGRASCRERV